ANRVRRGSTGIVAASGTGLQLVASRIHELGGGISHAIGTGGRDLSAEVDGVTACQALDLLGRDPETETIVLLSKPPSPTVAARVLSAARATGKPVVVNFQGFMPPVRRLGNVTFAVSLDEAAEMATGPHPPAPPTPGRGGRSAACFPAERWRPRCVWRSRRSWAGMVTPSSISATTNSPSAGCIR